MMQTRDFTSLVVVTMLLDSKMFLLPTRTENSPA